MIEHSTSATSDEELLVPLCAIFRRYLKRQGLKFTTERAITLDAVLAQTDVFEADAVLADIRGAGHRVSRATVYRTLKHLLEAGIISEVLIDSRQSHYQLSFGRSPRAHLVCVETNRIIEFPLPDTIKKLRDRICRKHGFEPVSARLVIYGVSPEAGQQNQADDNAS